MVRNAPVGKDAAVSATAPAQRLLLVEDDASLREVCTLVLEAAGFEVVGVGDGLQALDRFDDTCDVVVLDVMLPLLDGFSVCQELRRRSDVPIIMMTARGEPSDVVAGLQLGADDYIRKPFEPAELLARLRAVLRRTDPSPGDAPISVGDLVIDASRHRVTRHGEVLGLSATEFRLLAELAARPGHVLSREVLLERVWGYDYLGDSRLVDMAIKRLRDKVEDGDGGAGNRLITTVRGVGYRLDPPG